MLAAVLPLILKGILFVLVHLGTIVKYGFFIGMAILVSYISKEQRDMKTSFIKITSMEKAHLLPLLKENNVVIFEESLHLKERIFSLSEKCIVNHVRFPKLKQDAKELLDLGAKSSAKANLMLENAMTIGRSSSALIMKLGYYDKSDLEFEIKQLITLLEEGLGFGKDVVEMFQKKKNLLNNMTLDVAQISKDIDNQGYFLNMPAKDLVQNCVVGALAGLFGGPLGAFAGCGVVLAAFVGVNDYKDGNARNEMVKINENLEILYNHVVEQLAVLEAEKEGAWNFKNKFEVVTKENQKQLRSALQNLFQPFRALLFKLHPEEKERYYPTWTNQLLHTIGLHDEYRE